MRRITGAILALPVLALVLGLRTPPAALGAEAAVSVGAAPLHAPLPPLPSRQHVADAHAGAIGGQPRASQTRARTAGTTANAGTTQPPRPAARPSLPVALVADSITYDTTTGRVTATGNVEVYYGERTLTADRIIYDSRTGTITAEGKIILRDPSGATLFADFAEVDEELREGLVRGARAVIGENIRLSAVEARRIDARFNALSKAVYSPCRVCAANPTPLWRIRARRVIEDEEKLRIYYRDATFDVLGVPVLWLPWFSHPDPRAKRASGFLVPEFSHSSTYGYGVQVPYYWVIDDYSDFTFTPFVTTGDGVIAIGEYRRAFAAGDLVTRASGTWDDYQGEHEFHGHLELRGDFAAPALPIGDGFRWGFDGIFVTDDGYLRRYDFSDKDRLVRELYLRRYDSAGYFDLSALSFRSLRDDEPAEQIPLVLPAFDFRRELDDDFLGGGLAAFASSNVLLREQGLDTSRLTLGLDWDREEVLPSGLVLRGFARVRGDLFINDDFGSVDAATELRLRPLAGIQARFPLIAEGPEGAAHVLEPIGQIVLAPWGLNGDTPNEDSLAVEFDETGLFDLDHFPGLDRAEEGPRANLGLRYELLSAGPWRFDASVGRVLRLREADEFGGGSGLDGSASDWVGAWSVAFDPYMRIRQRLRLGDDLGITRNEIGAALTFGRLDLDLAYILLEADPLISAPDDREEVTVAGSFRLARNWWLFGRVQRDLQRDDFVEAGGGVRFENECCRIDLALKRDFVSSEDAPASTSVVLQVRLFTLGNRGSVAQRERP